MVIGVTTIPWPRLAHGVGLIALFVVLAAQPARYARAETMHHLPAYGTLVRASRQMVKYDQALRAVRADFLPPSTDPTFIYRVLGGRMNRDATLIATVSASGITSYRTIPASTSVVAGTTGRQGLEAGVEVLPNQPLPFQ